MSVSHTGTVVLRGGRVIDVAGTDAAADVLIRDGMIAEVGTDLAAPKGAIVLDAEGAIVSSGLVDIQVHFREPGGEDAETIRSGSRAAALGGFTAVVAMPNTTPPFDSAPVVAAALEKGRDALCAVHVAGCISSGRAGQHLAPMGELYDLGVRIFTDDGDCVADASLMRRAFEYARMLPEAVIAQHAEDANLVAGGAMNEGIVSMKLGVPGRPGLAESVIVARDLLIAEATGGRYHVLHMSTAESARLVREAKARGVRVTAECTPQHLVLTDDVCEGFDTSFKMNPPLRAAHDRDGLRAALVDGTIDAIATDHAPHAPATKERAFQDAPPGMLGVETALSVGLTELCANGTVTLQQLLAAMSWNPARIASMPEQGRPVAPGEPANLTVIDPAREWTVEPADLASKSLNTPWAGRHLRGKVRHTLHRGEIVVRDEEPTR